MKPGNLLIQGAKSSSYLRDELSSSRLLNLSGFFI